MQKKDIVKLIWKSGSLTINKGKHIIFIIIGAHSDDVDESLNNIIETRKRILSRSLRMMISVKGVPLVNRAL
jgi:hypothetical protein